MRTRLIRTGAAVAMALGAGGPVLATTPSASAPGSSCGLAIPPGFHRVPAPDFGAGEPSAVSSYLVARHQHDMTLATNGASVMATDDHGCHWRRAFSTERQAPTGATSPAGVIDGLLDLADGRLAIAVDPVEISLTADLPSASVDYLTPTLAVSADQGHTWSSFSTVPVTVRRLIAVTTPDTPSAPGQIYAIGVDARSQSVVLASNDAGQHWTVTNDAGAPGRGSDVTMIAAGPEAGHVWVAGHTLSESVDGGRTFTRVTGAPTGVSSLTVSGRSVAVAAEFGLYRRTGHGGWKRLSGNENGTVTGATYDPGGRLWATATRASGGALYEVDGHGGLVETAGPLQGNLLDEVQPTTQPGVVFVRTVRGGRDYGFGVYNVRGFKARNKVEFHAPQGPTFDHACYNDPNQPPPATWNPSWQPLPSDEPWLYITDFHDGGTFRIDRYGSTSQVAQTPGTPEGTALDPFGRIVISTRFSHRLVRMDPLTCREDVIDPSLPTNESPAFDSAGNLFAVDTEGAKIWEYAWPQRPNAHRVLVHDFRADPDREAILGLEDAKVAPAGTRYAGDVFVEVFSKGLGGAAGEFQDEIVARLHRGADHRWHRSTFWTLPAHFFSLGLAFLPTGELLVPDVAGSSEIFRVSADGRAATVFAVAATSFGGKALSRQLAKIDVTPNGLVYVSAPEASGRYCGDVQYTDVGGDAALFRFDPLGHEVDPPFTGLPFCPLGISVIHLFPQLPKSVIPLVAARSRLLAAARAAAPPVPAAGVGYAAVAPIPAPPQPLSQPPAQTQPNPNPQSQAQAQSQPNPNHGFAVGIQPEERPQLAFQDTDQMQMSRLEHRRTAGAGLFVMSTLAMTTAAGAFALRRRCSDQISSSGS